MTATLDIIPTEDKVDAGVRNSKDIASGLADVLADTYRLTFKTHGYHWNVVGPHFYSVHKLTEEQYNDMFAAADVVAERIRALGYLAPMKFKELTDKSVIKDRKGTPSAGEMIADLAGDHEQVAKRLHALADLAESQKDIVTVDLATVRAGFHEKAAWMLRATIAE